MEVNLRSGLHLIARQNSRKRLLPSVLFGSACIKSQKLSASEVGSLCLCGLLRPDCNKDQNMLESSLGSPICRNPHLGSKWL